MFSEKKADADPEFYKGRPTVTDTVKKSGVSKISFLQLGSRVCSKKLEAFRFSMFKYLFSHIPEALFLSFLTFSWTLEIDNKTVYIGFQSIWDIFVLLKICIFYLQEKVMHLKEVLLCKVRLKDYDINAEVEVSNFKWVKKHHCIFLHVTRNRSFY